MTLIDIDKFVASFITEMKECSQMRNFSISRCIKKALIDQGLEYKDGEVVRISDESEDERIRKEIIEFLKNASGGFLDTTTQCKTFGKWLSWLEKQSNQREQLINKACEWIKYNSENGGCLFDGWEEDFKKYMEE